MPAVRGGKPRLLLSENVGIRMRPAAAAISIRAAQVALCVRHARFALQNTAQKVPGPPQSGSLPDAPGCTGKTSTAPSLTLYIKSPALFLRVSCHSKLRCHAYWGRPAKYARDAMVRFEVSECRGFPWTWAVCGDILQ